MGIFSRLVSKKKKDEVEELFSDIKEESQLFEEFLRLHEEKINNVKKIIPQWKEGKIGAIEADIQALLPMNRRLWYLANEILKISKKERALFYFILKEKMNQTFPQLIFKRQRAILNRKNYKKYAETLEPYFEQLFDFLKSLSRVILLQTKTLKKKETPGKIAKDLIEKLFFHNLLVDETMLDRKIKQNLIMIVRAINQFLGYEKEYGLQFRALTEQEKTKMVIRKGVVFYEVRDVNSINFEKFYNLYEKSFPSDEIEFKGDLKSYLHYMALKLSIKEGDNRTHLIVGVLRNEVIAFSFFSTTYIEKLGICFGHGWWAHVDIRFRGFGVLEKLYRFREVIMQRDVKQYGASKLSHIFIDVNDPRKMNSKELQSHVATYLADPWQTLELFKKIGYAPMKHTHITPALPGKESVYYETLMIKPFAGDWINHKGIPLKDYLLIYWYDIRYGYDRIPEKDPTYRKVREDIIKSAVKGRVKFGWD